MNKLVHVFMFIGWGKKKNSHVPKSFTLPTRGKKSSYFLKGIFMFRFKKENKSRAQFGGSAYQESCAGEQSRQKTHPIVQKNLVKRRWIIALAYVGALTGAGLASGQELLQYFVTFGYSGLVAVCLVGLLHWAFGGITVALGSYFMARDQNQVLNNIGPAIVTKILDLGLMVDCFVLGFVMIAGAGSNLNQQFGFPIWMGALLCAVLVFVCSLFDFQKVSVVIGSFTPFIVGFISLAAVYVFFFTPVDFSSSAKITQTVPTTLPNVWVSLFNYFAMCLMTGASIAFVLGGEEYDSETAYKGGRIGGFLVGLVTVLETFTIFLSISYVKDADLPMLTLLTRLNAKLGFVMAILIYGMIFNTAISLYYALARRLTGKKPQLFIPTMGALVGIGYGLSFFGFKSLVAIVYPMIGYVGFILISVLLIAWIQSKQKVKWEWKRRQSIFHLMTAKPKEGSEREKKNQENVRLLIESSPVDAKELKKSAEEAVQEYQKAMKSAGEKGEEAEEIDEKR